MRDYHPDYITTSDHGWLARVVQTYVQGDGLPLHKIHLRLAHTPIPQAAMTRYRRAIRYLDKQVSHLKTGFSAREIRLATFCAVFKMTLHPNDEELDRILGAVSAQVGIEKPLLAKSLLADIEGEQIVSSDALSRNLYEIANEINLLFAKSLLRSASVVRIRISDHSRRVIRQAKLRGLICTTVKTANTLDLFVSGPLSLLRKTTMYGHALAGMLDSVVWCEQFEVMATCRLGDTDVNLSVKAGDPIRPGKQPRTFDSKIEEKFAAAILKKLPSWRYRREPEPIETPEGVIFPDFLLEHVSDVGMHFYCEIVGFWTKDYLERKMRQWSFVTEARYVLCINEKLKIEDESIPDDAPVYFFKTSINPQEVLRIALLTKEAGLRYQGSKAL